VKLLMESAGIKMREEDFDRTVLYRAAKTEHKEVVELLLEKGSDIGASGGV